MNNFFCAEASCQAKEDPIGCASNKQYYILLEFPPPWTSQAIDSKGVPSKLKDLKSELEEGEFSIRLVFIYNPNYYQIGQNRLIIYHQAEESFSGYNKREYLLSNIDDAVPIIEKCIRNEPLAELPEINIPTRDFLICTHGSQDKCCARYGIPFYRQAVATVEDLSLSHVRVWQSSHFGGHRFAPTMIDLPEARYYGRLDQKSFTAILTRTGDIQCLKNIYRGWGILPWQVQILERELILKYGWDWFNYQVQGRVIEANEEETFNTVEIILTTPNGKTNSYRCNIIEDESKSITLENSCSYKQPVEFPQFVITELVEIQKSLMTI